MLGVSGFAMSADDVVIDAGEGLSESEKGLVKARALLETERNGMSLLDSKIDAGYRLCRSVCKEVH